MLIGPMRQYILTRRKSAMESIDRMAAGNLAANLKTAVDAEFIAILNEFDKMEKDLWQARREDNRSLFKSVFGD